MKITIGITTYNRLPVLKQMAETLYLTEGLAAEGMHIRIYDDKSTDFGIADLEKLLPTAVQIIRRRKNMGANRNMYQMYHDFLETDDEYLYHADSDLIYHPGWLNFVKMMIPHTNGIFSIYNSAQHPVEGVPITVQDIPFVYKTFLGSAGVVLRRDLVKLVAEHCPPTPTFDWDWAYYLKNNGYPLLTSQRSYVQHIGLTGYNSDGTIYIDFGKGFFPGHPTTEAYLVDYYDTLLQRNDDTIRARLKEIEVQTNYYVRYDSTAYRLGKSILDVIRPVDTVLQKLPLYKKFRNFLLKSFLDYHEQKSS